MKLTKSSSAISLFWARPARGLVDFVLRCPPKLGARLLEIAQLELRGALGVGAVAVGVTAPP